MEKAVEGAKSIGIDVDQVSFTPDGDMQGLSEEYLADIAGGYAEESNNTNCIEVNLRC